MICITVAFLVPSGSPQDFRITTTSRTLTLSWSPPLSSQRNGVIISYLITCSSGGSIINSTRTSSTSLTITGLQPFTSYTCFVSAATIVGDGPAGANFTMTNEDSTLLIFFYNLYCYTVNYHLEPETSAAKFTSTSNDSLSIVLYWSAPVKPNGVITEYQLQCSGGNQKFNWTVMGSQTTTTLSGLLPYTNYSCKITAHTSVGGGPPAITSVTTQQDGGTLMLLSIQFVSLLLFQFPVDHLKTSQSLPPLIHSLSPGLLLSPHNVMESSSAISSPAAQEAASLTAPEPVVPV